MLDYGVVNCLSFLFLLQMFSLKCYYLIGYEIFAFRIINSQEYL